MIDISELEVFFINEYDYLEKYKKAKRKCLEENLKRLKGGKNKNNYRKRN